MSPCAPSLFVFVGGSLRIRSSRCMKPSDLDVDLVDLYFVEADFGTQLFQHLAKFPLASKRG